jgi:glycosyltransferase involved in cell wall biosynthesis
MSFPKITIITPVKNAAKTLEKSIQSLLQQNYPNLEYIVIDGASTDGTLDVIKKYEKNITHFESEDDGNNVIAHIKGIKKASGDIIAFLNADDFYEPGVLNEVAKAFIENKDLDVVSFCFRTIRDEKIIETTKPEDMELSRNRVIKVLGMNARFFKRNLFFKYGIPITHDEQGRTFVSNDLEYLSRFALLGLNNKIIDKVAYNYVAHEDSLTFSKRSESRIRLYEDRIFIAKKFLNSSEIALPKTWEETFKKWIKKYRAMLVVRLLMEKKIKEAAKNFISGVQENGSMSFVFYLIKTLIRSRKQKEVGF